MENSTRFDLTAALENWRAELAAQPNLTDEVRRELETHLRDTLAGFQQRGLTDEEAFWLARRRVGQPAQLSEEFVKADPAAVWRKRLFWITLAFFADVLWHLACSAFFLPLSLGYLGQHFLPDWVLYYLPTWVESVILIFFRLITGVPFIVLAVLAARGRLNLDQTLGHFTFQSRKNFVLTGLACVLAGHALCLSSAFLPVPHRDTVLFIVTRGLWYYLPFELSLIALIAWLLPSQNKLTPQTA